MSEGATRLGIALAAGCGATCCVHPLDVVRVNLQVDQAGARVYNGTLDCMRSIARRQGIFRGLYSGITAAYISTYHLIDAPPRGVNDSVIEYRLPESTSHSRQNLGADGYTVSSKCTSTVESSTG